MAETSTGKSISSNSNSSMSPISNLAQDHLFTILLLLPVESILSFAMTCKRFKSVAGSDTLWEYICRRDWGPTSVDALKSCLDKNRISYRRLYKQVSQLDSVCCHQLSDQDGELEFPSPRASHSLNFVSDCLVLFGGGCEGGRHLDDTWMAYVGDDFCRKLKWKKVGSGIPTGRFGHTCVAVGEYLVLFGGINDLGNRQNDTWVGQVTRQENMGITFSWRLLDVSTIVPPPRGAHAACCIEDRKMIIHGGIGPNGLRMEDMWVLEFSENLSFGHWNEITMLPSPPARSGHSLTRIGGSRAILFGGRGAGYEVLNDLWLLDMCDGHPQWTQMFYDLQNRPEGSALSRVGHSAVPILGGQLLIYGGEDSYRHRKDDFWVLDTSMRSSKLQLSTINSKGLLANIWKRLKGTGYRPKSRSFHRVCTDCSGCYLYIFGGMVDGVLQPAEASGLRFDQELFLVKLVLQL